MSNAVTICKIWNSTGWRGKWFYQLTVLTAVWINSENYRILVNMILPGRNTIFPKKKKLRDLSMNWVGKILSVVKVFRKKSAVTKSVKGIAECILYSKMLERVFWLDANVVEVVGSLLGVLARLWVLWFESWQSKSRD